MKLYWTHQHGAIIALGASSLVGMGLSSSVHGMQWMAMVFALSAFHATELAFEWIRKHNGLNPGKRVSLLWYALIAVIAAGYLFYASDLFRTLVPPLVCLAAAVTWINVAKVKKNVFAELLSFALIAALGLTTLNPAEGPDRTWIVVWATLSLYFGLSVFLVKLHFAKVNLWHARAYLGLIALVYAWTLPATAASFLILLVILRSFPFVLVPSWGGGLRLQHIGLMETGYAILMLVTFVMALGGQPV